VTRGNGDVTVRAVTPSRWKDLAGLFGPRGAYAGCWCMWFRETNADFERNGNEGNRRAMEALVRGNRQPGLVAYVGGEPAGWVSVAPREEFGRVERSPVLKRVDDEPVWSVVCFYVAKGFRGTGLARRLLDAAVDHAARKGTRVVEGYPWDTRTGRKLTNAEAFIGSLSMFQEAGFREVARRSPSRPIVRKEVG
jgi:GNAT superfamily N-acetyltransferase